MEGHAQKCVVRYCELANKMTEQLYKVSSPFLNNHQIQNEELESVADLSEVCSQIVLKCLYLARICRLDILWSVNRLARSVTKWTQACDRRLARLISHIHRTRDYRQYCHVGNTTQHFRLGLFQDSDFAGDLEDSKSTSGRVVYFWFSHTCAHQLDVQKAKFSVTQFYRIWNCVAGCWITYGRFTRSRFVGCGNWRIEFNFLQLTGNWSETKNKTKTQANNYTEHVDLSNTDQVPVNAHSS